MDLTAPGKGAAGVFCTTCEARRRRDELIPAVTDTASAQDQS